MQGLKGIVDIGVGRTEDKNNFAVYNNASSRLVVKCIFTLLEK
jgi:hypothetical protein